MEDILDIEKPTGKVKVYKENSIWLAAFLGGPLVAGYIIAENFKAFNQPDKMKRTWIITILASVVIFTIAFLLPDGIRIPGQFIPIVYAGVASMLMKHYQENLIREHISTGGQVYSWGRVALVGVIGLLIILAAIVASAVLSDVANNF